MIFFLFWNYEISLLFVVASLLFWFIFYLCRHARVTVYMEVKGQLPGVDFLLLPCGVQGLSSVVGPACKAFTCWTIWRSPLFPLLWGILLPFFLHVLPKAWFGPEWEAQYGLLLSLGFRPLPNQGPHSGITSGYHRAVWSCCEVLACLRTLLGNADKPPPFFGFDWDALLKVQFPSIEPDQSQRESWPPGQRCWVS